MFSKGWRRRFFICFRSPISGAKLLKEDLDCAQLDDIHGLKNKNKDLLLIQFKIRLRKDLLKETGILLLREEQLDLEKTKNLVKLQETTTSMINGKGISGKVGQVDEPKTSIIAAKSDILQGNVGQESGGEEGRRTKCYICHQKCMQQKGKAIEEMETGTEDLDVKEMDDTKMAAKILRRPIGSRVTTTNIQGILEAEVIGLLKEGRKKEDRRNFGIYGENIRGEPRREPLRGLGRQNGNRGGGRKAPITQVDLEEIPYICTLWVNERKCEFLVDIGAVVTLVRRIIIPARNRDVERSEEIRRGLKSANKTGYCSGVRRAPSRKVLQEEKAQRQAENDGKRKRSLRM
ncbi:hypothetical protein JTB14_024780 [Gonioctena quinquepunctata]|nr:hypothetical protein JTB14_024780 [Gonioctena quinquepunctata]